MRLLLRINILLCFLLLSIQTARADDDPNTIVFQETFDQNKTQGGRDGRYNGSIGSQTITYDNDGWTASKYYGTYQCVKFGTGSDDGVLTSPVISLGGVTHALLTFSAAGWGDSNKNTLAITANDGFTLTGDCNITELENEEWNDYTVLITVTSGTSLRLTFTGKRGFLDDVVVRTITSVPAPTLPDNFTFFPNTTEENASQHVTLDMANYTTAYYTTDGSTPSKTNGIEALQTTGIAIHGTTTVKAVAYVGDMQSQVVTKTYTQGNTVNGIAAFKALTDGTEVRLYLADNDNARVLHGYNNNMYLRDNSGAICLDFGTTATFNPAPVHNQHVAGWVVGRKQTVNGLTKLVATSNTTTDFLALAAPVTETATEPNSISAQELNNYLADWVTLTDLRVGDVSVTGAYVGALVDISAIATANNQLAPVAYNDIKPIVYVIDEDKDFVRPSGDIANATVRLKRTLSKDYWNTFVVPFDITSFDGKIRVYDAQDGNTMNFVEANQIVAGIPYLVKPNANIANPVFDNVTLSATPASNQGSNYYFVATYSPKDLATDGTQLFLTTDGKLAYPQDGDNNRLKGMRAYFQLPSGATAPTLVVDGSPITGIEGLENLTTDQVTVFDLSGRKIYSGNFADCKLPRGVYIVNGKKLIIH